MFNFKEAVGFSDTIDPSEYGINLGLDMPIDSGESRVYLGNTPDGRRIVFKLYVGFNSELIDINVLRKYRALTNKVARFVQDNQRLLELVGYNLLVKPINRVGKTSDGYGCAISDYVPGPNLREDLRDTDERSRVIQSLNILNDVLLAKFGKSARIELLNAKFSPDRLTLIITDCCGVVSGLNPAYWDKPVFLG